MKCIRLIVRRKLSGKPATPRPSTTAPFASKPRWFIRPIWLAPGIIAVEAEIVLTRNTKTMQCLKLDP
jgi:hypothetical protein